MHSFITKSAASTKVLNKMRAVILANPDKYNQKNYPQFYAQKDNDSGLNTGEFLLKDELKSAKGLHFHKINKNQDLNLNPNKEEHEYLKTVSSYSKPTAKIDLFDLSDRAFSSQIKAPTPHTSIDPFAKGNYLKHKIISSIPQNPFISINRGVSPMSSNVNYESVAKQEYLKNRHVGSINQYNGLNAYLTNNKPETSSISSSNTLKTNETIKQQNYYHTKLSENKSKLEQRIINKNGLKIDMKPLAPPKGFEKHVDPNIGYKGFILDGSTNSINTSKPGDSVWVTHIPEVATGYAGFYTGGLNIANTKNKKVLDNLTARAHSEKTLNYKPSLVSLDIDHLEGVGHLAGAAVLGTGLNSLYKKYLNKIQPKKTLKDHIIQAANKAREFVGV